jgi:hypothetical protein
MRFLPWRPGHAFFCARNLFRKIFLTKASQRARVRRLAVDARALDGQVGGSLTAEVERSYRLEPSARGVTI